MPMDERVVLVMAGIWRIDKDNAHGDGDDDDVNDEDDEEDHDDEATFRCILCRPSSQPTHKQLFPTIQPLCSPR